MRAILLLLAVVSVVSFVPLISADDWAVLGEIGEPAASHSAGQEH